MSSVALRFCRQRRTVGGSFTKIHLQSANNQIIAPLQLPMPSDAMHQAYQALQHRWSDSISGNRLQCEGSRSDAIDAALCRPLWSSAAVELCGVGGRGEGEMDHVG